MSTPLLDNPAIARGCDTLVLNCGDVKPGESVLVVSDPGTEAMGQALAAVALRVTDQVRHLVVPAVGAHGVEPPDGCADTMLSSDVIFGIRAYSMAHCEARRAACERGARYLSLPDYSPALLAGESLQVDFRALTARADDLAARFTAGDSVRVTTALGTDITLGISGRAGNSAPGWCQGPGALASPPDAEANVPPLETQSFGTIVIDGSIPCPELGVLDAPITLTVDAGVVVAIEGHGHRILQQLFDAVGSERARVIAELGVGLNPKARLTGNMLEDEGCAGTAHFGIGSNATIGGINAVPFHLDHVVRSVTLAIDGEVVVRDGVFVEEVRS